MNEDQPSLKSKVPVFETFVHLDECMLIWLFHRGLLLLAFSHRLFIYLIDLAKIVAVVSKK